MDKYDSIDKSKLRITEMGNEIANALYNDLCRYNKDNAYKIGNVLMRYITQQYPVKDSVNIIREILNDFSNSFLIHELSDGEVERLRKIIKQI